MSIYSTPAISAAVGGTSTAVSLGTAVVKSLATSNSLLNSTIRQLITGEYTVYVSDIVSIFGAVVGAFSVGVMLYKILKRSER